MKHTVSPAIRRKRLLKLKYGGYERLVEPHVYGLDRCGEPTLLCYEVWCECAVAEPAGWKQLKLREAEAISETAQGFDGARLGYKRNDTGFQAIFAQL